MEWTEGGVYQIRCTRTGDKYIGCTISFYYRKIFHFTTMRHHKHSNPNVRAAVKLHGIESFVFEVIKSWKNMKVKGVNGYEVNNSAYKKALKLEAKAIAKTPKSKLLNVHSMNGKPFNYRNFKGVNP